MEESKIILPSKKSERRRLGQLIESSISADEPLLIISGTCPDYSHHTDPKTGKEVYDFNGLGSHMGINTESLFLSGAPFFGALQAIGVKKMKYLVSFADVEADDPEILASVGLIKQDFVTRVQKSAQKAQEIGDEMYGGVLRVGMMSDLLLPEDYKRAEVAIGLIKQNALDDIAVSRADLYSRWFRKSLDINELSGDALDKLRKRRALEDVKKYMTFGFAARRMNAIILEATAPKITRLYNFGDGYSTELGLVALPPSPPIIIEDEH